MGCITPGFSVPHQLLEFAQTHVHPVSDATQLSHLLSSPSPPAFNLSQHQVSSNELALRTRWPNYWSFRFSISPSSEYSGLISFRTDWFDLLAVQGTPKSLLRHHNFYFIQMSSDIVNLPLSSVWPLHSPQWKNHFTP